MNVGLTYILIGILIIIIIFIYFYKKGDQQISSEGYRVMPENEPVGEIVLYYSTTCGFCTMFMPVWDQFEKHAAERIPGLKVTKVKCDGEAGRDCFEKGVMGFPTVIIYPTHGDKVMFEKNRTVDDLVKFVDENRKK